VPPSSDVPQKRVLIVDDSKFVRTTFARILATRFAVREEADGEAAWQAIETDPSIVMVFTDLDMPKLSGLELIGRVRGARDARIRDLPLVVISGNEDPGNMQRAREAGANEFIAKSAEATEVLARLENVLRLVAPTQDPATGAPTPQYLLTEGRKRFSYAQRHGTELAVLALRIESHAAVVRAAGKEAAEQLMASIAKLVLQALRAEDTLARTAANTFVVVAAGSTGAHMTTLGQRLRAQLAQAKVTYGKQSLPIDARFGVAALGVDAVNAIEALIQRAVQRLAEMPAAPVPEPATPAPALPAEVERALLVLERAVAAAPREVLREIVRRLQRIARTIQAKDR
jgi:two-component system cell cycle response regulator